MGPWTLSRMNLRRSLLIISICAMVGLVGWGAVKYGLQSRAARLKSFAIEALRGSRTLEAEEYAARLEAEGHVSEARAVRGELRVAEARKLLERRRYLAQLDRVEVLARTLLDAPQPLLNLVGPGGTSAILDPLNWQPALAAQPRGAERRSLAERAEAVLVQAVRELESIPASEPAHDQATILLAEALTNLRELDRPVPLAPIAERLKAITERQPNNLEARRRLAQIYIDLNAFSLALAQLQEVARLDPLDGRPCRFMGVVLRDSLREGEAIAAYEEALKRRLEPHVAVEVREELAQLLIDQGFPQKALQVLHEGPPVLLNDPLGKTLAAAAYWSLNEREKARALVEAALRDDSQMPRAIRLLAQMEMTEEKPENAQRLLRKLLQADPHDEKARHLLIDACRMTGEETQVATERERFEQTAGRLREVTRLGRRAHANPIDDQSRVEIARLWLSLGRRAEARSWLRSALAANPQCEEARRLLRFLDQSPR